MARTGPAGSVGHPPATPPPGHRIAPPRPPPPSGADDRGIIPLVSSWGGISRRGCTSAAEIDISASRPVRARELAVPSLPRPQPMVWPGDEAASLVDNHHPCAGIPAPDPGWPTTPPGSPSDGSRGDPAPGAKCGKRRIDQTHCSRRGRPTLTCRRRPRPAATRTNRHTRSPRRQRPATPRANPHAALWARPAHPPQWIG
jgi:hypothetical protein